MNIDLVLRWMHILGAIVLVGGTIFLRLTYCDSESSSEVEKHRADVRRRWSKMVGATVGLLLLSGIFNIGKIISSYDIDADSFPGSAYHAIFGIKFLLAFVVFFLSSALAGKSGLAEKLRKQEKKWLTINVVLAIAVVLLAGVMKVTNRVPKDREMPGVSSIWPAVESDASTNVFSAERLPLGIFARAD